MVGFKISKLAGNKTLHMWKYSEHFLTSLLYSCIFKFDFCLYESCLNPFLEVTSTKQWENSFFLKEPTGDFDGAQTYYDQSWIRLSEPCRPFLIRKCFIKSTPCIPIQTTYNLIHWLNVWMYSETKVEHKTTYIHR